MKIRIYLYLIITVSLFTACKSSPKNDVYDFKNTDDSGVFVLHDTEVTPDIHGVFMAKPCDFPVFEKGIYYSCDWWPTGSNRVYGKVFTPTEIPSLQEGGMFLLLKINNEKYLAVLPLASPLGNSWFDNDSTHIVLKFGHHGKDTVKGDLPLFAWSFAQNPYEACNKVWSTALHSEYLPGVTKMREEKPFPEMFRYLGWCSWEQFHKNIDEENMTKAVSDIENSGIPIRYFLIDDGYFDTQSLQVKNTFPDGLSAITKLKKEDKIKWMGLWHAMLGDNFGIKAPGNIGSLSGEMFTCAGNKLLPIPEDSKAADDFMNYVLSASENNGFDFVKVDFQSHALAWYAGISKGIALNGLPETNENAVGNPVNAAITLTKSLQQTAEKMGLNMLNCNWHQTVNLLYSGNSVVGRCSEDYSVGKLKKAKAHLYHSYAAIPWLGQIAWGDHDMFHSNDPFAGEMMAVSKAVSGGPVYLSDDPTQFKKKYISPLCYENGELLRPLAPAAPLPDDLFIEPEDKSLYRIVAPLQNGAAAIVAYNFEDDDIERELTISANDYKAASSMIQPYPGEWTLPHEGVYLYDWYNRDGMLLNEAYTTKMKEFSDRLFILTPVENGWSIIGRPDKFLSAAACEIQESTPEKITLSMKENGPLVLWCKDKVPVSANFTFYKINNEGLWLGALEKTDNQRKYIINTK